MERVVGVQGLGVPSKREALLFEQIYITDLDAALSVGGGARVEAQVALADLDYLRTRGVVRDPLTNPALFRFDVLPRATSTNRGRDANEVAKHIEDLWRPPGPPDDCWFETRGGKPYETCTECTTLSDQLETLRLTRIEIGDLNAQAVAALASMQNETDVVPILNSIPQPVRKPHVGVRLADITIRSLPVPSDDVPWEQIIDFRDDPDNRRRFQDLQYWMRRMVQEGMSDRDISNDLDYQIRRYEDYMRVQKLKFRRVSFRTLISVPAGIVEDILHARFRSALDMLFSVKDIGVELAEAELGAPGRNLAYVVKARDQFA